VRKRGELSRLYVVTNLSRLCKKPALITRRNQETSSDCARDGERVCVLSLPYAALPALFCRYGVVVSADIFAESRCVAREIERDGTFIPSSRLLDRGPFAALRAIDAVSAAGECASLPRRPRTGSLHAACRVAEHVGRVMKC